MIAFKRYFFLINKIDKLLIIVLLTALILCLYGITWGKVESWNPDDVGFLFFGDFKNILRSPGWFLKPPFQGYFNFFLSYIPLRLIEFLFNLPKNSLASGFIALIWSRILTIILFLGSIVLVFQITKRFFGVFAARIITFIFATSAGLIAYTHFLTTDIPAMFWMLLAFYFSQNILFTGNRNDYILAGLFTGIATATKYNALAIGLTIVVSHALSFNQLELKKMLLSKKLFIGLIMIVLGFVLANPFALLDYQTFISDFWYNYVTTPVYDGKISGNSYWKFLICFQEIIGFPSIIIFCFSFLAALYLTFIKKDKLLYIKPICLLLSVFLVYYYKFGSFPRLETRFVLPILPFWLIISGPFWNKVKPNKILVLSILIILIGYNTVSSFYVGKRFTADIRMVAQTWVTKNIPELSSIESTSYNPTWNKLPNVRLKNTRFPKISGRRKTFYELFKDNSFILKIMEKHEGKADNLNWYTLEELVKRNPQYIAINSLYYQRFIDKPDFVKLYPEVNTYFNNLIQEKYPYRIVFDKESNKPPTWVYPENIDFLHNRMIIFAKK
ncbi:phospholipid carrier-dependent glycosyltransferase [Tolypothrix sp. PCC 7910]|uniref:ArnT family glycosyltransferase n=1 Tax=Tolypothrix sp. PCC 7910 TaxID=2099387 RepID=UPI0014278DD2|nr:glycosyltransferase family 39 protein [Tolypothrix sp. PCC 7910]QIR41164.1 phospholipid carrier-dependent glycosyltransferase [Tolypothrix sp. PCC 7910]